MKTLTLTASNVPDEHFRRIVLALVQQWRDKQGDETTA